jgi:subtilase family serine protease
MYVQNVGPGAAGAFAVDFSGHCDNYTFSAPPHRVEGLAPGADAFIRLSISLPMDTNCLVVMTIDHDNAVQESNESNNEVSVAVTVQ